MATARAILDEPVVVDLRELRGADLGEILAEQTVQWRERFRWDFSGSRSVLERYLDSCGLHGYALAVGGVAVGYSYFIVDAGKALVGDVFLRSAHRLPALENMLITRTLEAAAVYPGVRRVEGQLLGLDSPLSDGFVFHRPLEIFPRSFLLREQLRSFQAPRAEPEGVRFLNWSDYHLDPTAELIAAAYQGHDDARINDQYRSISGALRFLSNTTKHPGCGTFLRSASWVAMRPNSLSLSGACLATQVYGDAGHIAQICVAPEERGRGVGRELLRRTMMSLRALGCNAVSLTVTASNQPAMHLYREAGFEERKRFPALVRESG